MPIRKIVASHFSSDVIQRAINSCKISGYDPSDCFVIADCPANNLLSGHSSIQLQLQTREIFVVINSCESTCSIPCRLPASMHATGYGYVSRMCKGNYVVPLLTAGYDMLHLEARYNHEDFHTVSLWRSHCSAVAFRGRYVAADARYRNQQQLRSRCLHRLRRHEL